MWQYCYLPTQLSICPFFIKQTIILSGGKLPSPRAWIMISLKQSLLPFCRLFLYIFPTWPSSVQWDIKQSWRTLEKKDLPNENGARRVLSIPALGILYKDMMFRAETGNFQKWGEEKSKIITGVNFAPWFGWTAEIVLKLYLQKFSYVSWLIHC